MPDLPVLKIQRFSTHDGPGIRTTVFLQGCPLRCAWCHNPESQEIKPQFFYQDSLCIACEKCATVCKYRVHAFKNGIHTLNDQACTFCMDCVRACPTQALERVSRLTSIDEILAVVEKDREFYGRLGGITLSGGEPLLHGETVLTLLREAKRKKLRTAVETCGYFNALLIPKLVDCVDLFLYDIKDTDDTRHRLNTGVDTETILSNLQKIDESGGKTVLRCILLNGVNDDSRHLDNLVRLYKAMKNCLRVEIFPYHHYGESKYLSLRVPYTGKKEWIPEEKQLKSIAKYFQQHGVPCKITE